MILSQFITAFDYAGHKILGWNRLSEQETEYITDGSMRDLLWFFCNYGWLLGYAQFYRWIK